jgi:tetratricopeptide (TPR) repeat protein
LAKRQSKSTPTWANVKAKLAGFDRTALMSLVQNLYAAHKENRAFLHARLGLGDEALQPYKKTIDRWLWPDVFRRQETSVSKAKQAISDYKKALGDPEGMAELMVFYCERAAGFSKGVSHDDAGYFDALLRMFEQSLKITNTLAGNARRRLLTRLDRVRNSSHEFGYGVGDEMDVLLFQGGSILSE